MNEKHKFKLITHFKDGEIISETFETPFDKTKLAIYIGGIFEKHGILGIPSDKDTIKYIQIGEIKYFEIKEL